MYTSIDYFELRIKNLKNMPELHKTKYTKCYPTIKRMGEW